MQIVTIRDFYTAMRQSSSVRRRIVSRILGDSSPEKGDIDSLRSLLAALKALSNENRAVKPQAERRNPVRLNAGRRIISLELNYEISELEKDLVFLEQGEDALLSHLAELHPGFQEELDRAVQFCGTLSFPLGCLISDRDGTVNNYCGRYLSSIQSAYNAVFLSRFAAAAVQRAVILTSAPLSADGLEELTVSPPGTFILAGSKGREYLDEAGRRGALAIEPVKQKKLDRLNQRLARLLREPRYELFALIGSGLQFKFGQTTVARQDISGSIPAEESEGFRRRIEELIQDIDPGGLFFRTEDTGKDIEIILTVENESGLKDFDKGDGILFLEAELDLGLSRGANLICGDTSSDIPMVAAALTISPATSAIFVTREPALMQAVRRVYDSAHFLSEPDLLVCLLNQLGKERA